MKNFFILIGFTYIGVSHLFCQTYWRDKSFKKTIFSEDRFKFIKPNSFLNRFLFCYKKELGMVNVCFYIQVFTYVVLLLSLFWFLTVYCNKWYLNDTFLRWHSIIVSIVVICLVSILLIADAIHFHLLRKYEKEKPVKANYRKINKKISRGVALNETLSKYCYIKEKGVFYIDSKDIERIRKFELVKYKNVCDRIQPNENGEMFLTIYDTLDDSIIFQAPIKM